MNKLFLLILIFLSLSLRSVALDASVSYACFFNGSQNYIEVYLHMIGSTISANPQEGEKDFMSKVDVLILVKDQDDIIAYKKYTLNSPVFKEALDFQDLKRIALSNGRYKLEVKITDHYDKSNFMSFKDDIKMMYDSEKVSFSDIQFVSSASKSKNAPGIFSKQGYEIEILPYDFLDDKYENLSFYMELYNSNKLKTDLYMSFYAIEGYKGEKGKSYPVAYKKIEAATITPLFLNLNIDNLPSGNYHLMVELRDREKNLIMETARDFKRSSPLTDYELSRNYNQNYDNSFVHKLDKNKLDYYLKAIVPIVDYNMSGVLNSVVNDDNITSKRYFIYSHFSKDNPQFSEKIFNKYMEFADAVHKMYYSGFGYGFETDRGYIYLKYGRPTNSITVTDEPSAPPYEIWVYDDVKETEQNNVKFVFYNPSLVHNDFRLLHSTCRGERNNPAWEVELYRDAISENNNSTVDSKNVSDNINRNAKRLFNDL